jgi:hypothetical protein
VSLRIGGLLVGLLMGPDYRYFTNSLNKTMGEHTLVSAGVQAWNDHEVLSVPVQWQE